jgi:hypothetical protein
VVAGTKSAPSMRTAGTARKAKRTMGPASLVSFAVCIGAMVGAMRPRPDTDTWWHLATGRWILDNRAIPTTDPFSWTAQGKEWVAHEWATEALFALVDRAFGPIGLLVMQGMLIGAVFLLLRRVLRRVVDNEWAVVVALLVAFALSAIMWNLRPHLISAVLIVWFLDRLVAYRLEGGGRAIWWLLPLTILWANLHAGFISGVLLVWVFAVVDVVERRRTTRLLWVAVGVTVAGALNPAGPAIYLFSVYLARVSDRVAEWQPPGVRDAFGILFTVVTLGVPAALAFARKRFDAALLATALFFGFLGLGAIRNVWIAGLVGAPALAIALNAAVRLPKGSAALGRERRVLVGAHVVVLLGAALFAYTLLSGKSESYLRGEGAFPKAAAARLAQLPEGRLANPYDWGGYLIWKVPEFPVSVDPRADLYGDELLDDAYLLESLKPGWQEFLDDKDVRYVLWQRQRPLAEALRLLDYWSLVYEDSQAVVFMRSER